MDERCISNIYTKLESYGIDVDRFITNLKKDNYVIAGGFVLSCMIGQADLWNSDIDIYRRYNGNPIRDFTQLEGDAYQYANYQPQKVISDSRYTCLEDIFNIKTYECDRFSMDIIDVKIDVNEFICKTFDLSFCKLAFDGDRIMYYGLDRHGNETLNYQQLICRWGVFQSLTPHVERDFNEYSQLVWTNLRLSRKTSLDIIQYYDRQTLFPKVQPILGDKGLSEEDEAQLRRVERYLKSLKRIRKYQSRGFKVLGF